MTAEQLTESIWLVGTADQQSPAFTSTFDGNMYLVDAGAGAYLIDAGSGLGADPWLANVEAVRPLDQINGVLLSHYHADHCGGSAAAIRSGLHVLASPATARALRDGDEEVTQVRRARQAGVYPPEYVLEAVSVVHQLPDAHSFAVGTGTLTALSAPGHCDGHLVFVYDDGTRRALFSGDVIFAGGHVSIQAIPDCRLDAYAETVAGIDELCLDQLFSGHGPAVLHDARTDIARAAHSFRALIPPPNLLSPPGYD